MAWSEKAIKAALEAFWGCEIYPKYDWRSLTAMHSALNAAATVDGDAQWNAALEAAAVIVSACEGPHRYVDDMVDAICALKRG